MIEYDAKTQAEKGDQQIEISKEIEELLTSKINECFSNEKFKELPIEIIYRIIEKSSPNEINSNKLYDIIIKSLSKYCVLFQFLDLQKLSEDRLEELCEMYSKSNENTRFYFDYLKCNLNLINEINNCKKNLQEMNVQQQNKMKDLEDSFQKQLNEQQNKMKDLETLLQKQFNEQLQNQVNYSKGLENQINQLQNQLNDSKNLNNEQQNKMKDLETLLHKQFNEQLQNQVNYSKDLEKQINQLQNQFNKLFMINGQIVASVEKGFIINAEINLKTQTLDTTKSKVIISTSDVKYLGSEAYDKGEPITSLQMKTSFACKPGRYYVRCIVFNSEGESKEIMSNSVTTSGSCLSFDYEGKPAKISLPQGQYKLEVWGAKGGDSTGNGDNGAPRGNQSKVQGGLGGYSRGILRLNKEETVYVFVGEEGHPSNSSDGSSTNGAFPDGGGTKTGHYSSFKTVPGTGGGSTSIRIGSDSNHSRVIVAGGGGGASGDYYRVDPGGFGGGLSGGNSSNGGSLGNQGAGTQIGSTQGLGNGEKGDPGVFGLGATGKYKQGCDSGGGGGGGWFGGGSGGYGNSNWCGSGGGGSGWTFTESSLKTFQTGDSANASKFTLTSDYYLTDEKCVGGNEEFPRPDGNGNERGHSGNGYAKITFL